MELETLISALTVFLFAMGRFNVPPPSVVSCMALPARANTTVFRYWLYRTAYGVIGVLVFAVATGVPGVMEGIRLLAKQAGLDAVIPADPTPFVIAVVVLLLPVVPVFKLADNSIRRALYERALIPAEQLRLQGRLRTADYQVQESALAPVREDLGVDGFNREDIVYEAKPTTRSLWTKAAVLIKQVEAWQALDEYKTAFAVIKEQGCDKRTCAQVKETYEALKGDAKTCFKTLREQPGQQETQLREDNFRHQCKQLLDCIYALLSRVSLHSHYSERDRVTSLREIGFQIEPRHGGPVPDLNDLVCLLILIGTVVMLPLWHKMGLVRALAITTIYFTATLTPLLMAAHCPRFAMGRDARTLPVACPVVSGLVAVALGIVISVVSRSFVPEFPGIDLTRGWHNYVSRAYPWSFLVFLVAALLSMCIRSGKYPDVSSLKGIQRYRQWGSLADALVFVGCTALLMFFIVIPRLRELNPAQFGDDSGWSLLLIPVATTFVIGFFVPTWYRANKLRVEKESSEQQSNQLPREHPPYGDTATV